MLVLLLAAIVFLAFRAMFYPMIQVTSYDAERSAQGYTLFAPTVDDLGYSLTEPGIIYLLDMKGETVHTWNVLSAVQLVQLKPDGNLLYSTRDRSFVERAGVREIDPVGNVVWYYPVWVDHDFYLLENDHLLIHYIEDKDAPAIGPGPIRCPGLVEVNRDKEVVWEWRGEEHLEELTELVGIQFPLEKEGQKLFDWAHNNTCQVIGDNDAAAKDSRFGPGNILISYCNLNTIAVIDKETGQIVWAWGPGVLDGQHNPRMMPNGLIMIFDNGTERGYSRVIELDPLSGEIAWEYADNDTQDPRFHSPYISSAQPLFNGNVFVCQGGYSRDGIVDFAYRAFHTVLGRNPISSRLFEVDREGRIVWDCAVTASGKNMHGVYQAARYSELDLQKLFAELEGLEDEETRRLRSLPYIR